MSSSMIFIGIRTAVEEIADNVVVHREPLNERRAR